MNRREFIALSTTAGALGLVSINKVFAEKVAYPTDELLGKEHPQLFGTGFRLRKRAAEAFADMQSAAAKQGITIYSQSSFRDYNHQNRIWVRKFERYRNQGLSGMAIIEKIIRYSTIPGTSRHHWGTDLDVVDHAKPRQSDPLLARHFNAGGVFEELGEWLRKNAVSYGFYEVYTNDPVRKGFAYEPWHLSFAEMAKPMLKDFLNIDLKKELQVSKLLGSEYFTDSFVDRYIRENMKGINRVLL